MNQSILFLLIFMLPMIAQTEECKLPNTLPKSISIEPSEIFTKEQAQKHGFKVGSFKALDFQEHHFTFSEFKLCTVNAVSVKMISGNKSFKSKLSELVDGPSGYKTYAIETPLDQNNSFEVVAHCCDSWSFYQVNF